MLIFEGTPVICSLVRLVILYIIENKMKINKLQRHLIKRIKKEKAIKTKEISIEDIDRNIYFKFYPTKILENNKCWIVYYESMYNGMRFYTFNSPIGFHYTNKRNKELYKYIQGSRLEYIRINDKETILINFCGGNYFEPVESNEQYPFKFIKHIVRIYWKHQRDKMEYQDQNQDYVQIVENFEKTNCTGSLERIFEFYKKYNSKMKENEEIKDMSKYLESYHKVMKELWFYKIDNDYDPNDESDDHVEKLEKYIVENCIWNTQYWFKILNWYDKNFVLQQLWYQKSST